MFIMPDGPVCSRTLGLWLCKAGRARARPVPSATEPQRVSCLPAGPVPASAHESDSLRLSRLARIPPRWTLLALDGPQRQQREKVPVEELADARDTDDAGIGEKSQRALSPRQAPSPACTSPYLSLWGLSPLPARWLTRSPPEARPTPRKPSKTHSVTPSMATTGIPLRVPKT